MVLAAENAFQEALKLQESGHWAKAQKAFRAFVKEHPDSPRRGSAEERSGDNAYLGCTKVWESGPPARRIDIAVMGDGFTLDDNDQKIQERWAHDVARRLWQEPLFSEYRRFFNIYFVRLASKEKGVDKKQNPRKKKKQKDVSLFI